MIRKSAFIYLFKRNNFLLSYIILVILSSCNPMGDNKVEILTQGALDPVKFFIEGGSDHGEFLVGGDAAYFTLVVENNNGFRISNLNLDVDAFSSAAMKFATNEDGKSISPGLGGTCQKTLESKKTCTYIVEYNPTFSGNLNQKFTFTYNNLVNSMSEKAEITLLAGEAANLSFVSEIINYDYGYMERTEPEKISKKLTVINTGGLTARDMQFGVLYSHNSGAFDITENTCGKELPIGSTCHFIVDYIPKNYASDAPDGDDEATYTCNPRIDYVRDPDGSKGALTAYFTALSTTIEGRILSSGITQLEFSELTVGNKESKTVKIQNYGYKEAIVHNVEVYDSADNKVATCIKLNNNDELVCQDPLNVSNTGSALPISTLPLKITDTTGCINNYEDLDYTRDESGILSNPSLYKIIGKTNTAVGGSCFLDLTFWPSVSHTSNGNINDYKLRFKFDSTWKNGITLYGYDNTYDHQFLISEASWLSAAHLEVSEYRYGTKSNYVRETGTADNIYLYDLGRIALISNNSYKQGVKISFKNIGYTDADVLSVTDAKTTPNVLTENTVDLNPYYLSTGHVGCNIVTAIGGDCNIRYNLAPMASSLSGTAAETEENNNMFDVTNPYPQQYKKFIITYKDGSLYNDDGSLRTSRSIEVWSRALLVRKGFLVFESTDTDQGTKQFTTGDTPIFHHIILKNAGTGGIPTIEKISNLSLSGSFEKSNNRSYPYEMVDRPDIDNDSDGFFDGEAGADKDCYDIIVDESSPLNPVSAGTNANSVLDAGETCSLTIKMKNRGSDVVKLDDYDEVYRKEWSRFFDSDYQNDYELWEEEQYNSDTKQVSFRYYDGDGVSDIANGYYPDEDGYGNYYSISGGVDGRYGMQLAIRQPGGIVPLSPLPSIASTLCRDEVQLPSYVVPAHEWGTGLSASTIPEMCIDYSDGKATSQVSYHTYTADYVKANNSGYDYIFHAGTFSAGSNYDLSFALERVGQSFVKNAIHNYSGDTSIINWTNSWSNPLSTFNNNQLTFEFSPSVAGTFSTDLIITYENGERILNDEDTFSYTDQTVTLRIKIIADAINPGMDNLALEVQDYAVSYDNDTDSVDDSTLKGSSYNVGLHHNADDMVGNGVSFYGIRDSSVYAKKVFTFQNNGSNSLTNVIFNLKSGINASAFTIPAGTGIKLIENNCVDITLNSGDTCTVTMHFQASRDEIAQTITYGSIVYNMGGIAYQMKNFQMVFDAADPAILETSPKIATKIIKDENNLNIKSIPLDLGLYSDSGHPVVESSPVDRFSKSGIIIKNVSLEKASFLAQWEAVNGITPLPSSSWIEIYNSGGIVVEANRFCFFGDDENDNSVDDDLKGFNLNSVNACRMNFHIDLDDKYFGREIDTSESYFKLKFYNNMRASTSESLFHFTGFVEPNRSDMSNNDIYNVVTNEEGDIYFEWDSAVASNSSWGGLTGYRVFYSATKNSLNDVFKAASYIDTTNRYIDISGLIPGRYYYIKIAARRITSSGKEYTSSINAPIKEVIVPPEGYVYSYDEKILLSKTYSSQSGPDLKEEGAGVCASSVVTLSENGAVKNKPMKLINTSIWSLIESDDSYSDYDTDTTPHWMADNPVDISFLFADFSCSEASGDDGGTNFYTKDCTDCSCNNLSIVKGGDGQFLPPGSTIYIDGGAMSAFFRCYIDE